MSLDTVGTLCHEFKILRQESKLNIVYYLGECLKHSFDLVKSLFKLQTKCGYCKGKNHVWTSRSQRL